MFSSLFNDESADSNDKWEIVFGLALAMFAAALSINELGAGRFGEDAIQLGNDKAKAYSWYQSKSIKESLVQGQYEMLDVLGQSGSIAPEKAAAMDAHKQKLKSDVARYRKEKDEILRGSLAVGPENYAQDIDGKMGVVRGALELETQQAKLAEAGDEFDLATLFLQLCLVLGAIGLIVKNAKIKVLFLAGLVSLGVVGSFFCFSAYTLAFAAGA